MGGRTSNHGRQDSRGNFARTLNSIVYFHNRRVGENGRVTRHSGAFGFGSLNGDTGRRIE